MGWLILALMGAVTFLYGLSIHATLLCLLVKPLPVLALLGWLHDAPPATIAAGSASACCFPCSATCCWPGPPTCSCSA